MSRTGKWIRNAAIGIIALIIVVVIAGVVVVRTDWFREYVRQEIISATEKGTGGKVDLGAFHFDVSGMRATITGFVIHGSEPAGAAPFVSIARAEVRIRLLPALKRLFEITYVGVDQPQANIMVLADGRTNIPTPRQQSTSNKSALETVVDLAIGRFELSNGMLTLESRKQPLNVRGNNLRAQLAFNRLTGNYEGTLALEPLYVVAGRNTPVNARITLPVLLGKDRIDFRNASIATQASDIRIDGSVQNMRDPKISAHLNGRISMIDLKNAGNLQVAVNTPNTPSEVDVDASATVGSDVIRVTSLRVGLGKSNVEASGTLKGPTANAPLVFRTKLAVGELGRLFRVAVKAEDIVEIAGNARMDERNLQVNALRMAGFGVSLDGRASLEDFHRYKFDGNLRALDIQTVLHAMNERLPYEGFVSGTVSAAGDTTVAGTTSVVAETRLTISSKSRGIPVSGRLSANYSGAADDVSIENSFLALPHTRLTLDGSLKNRLGIALTSRDLGDLLAAVPTKGPPPVVLNRGVLSFNGSVSGGLTAPSIAGHLAASQFGVAGRQFDALAADVTAAGSGAAVRNGSLTRAGAQNQTMQVQFSAAAGMRNWKTAPRAPVSADLSVRNADLADVLALAGQSPAGYTGPLTATAHVGGTVGNPQGTANMQVGAGTIEGEPFDQAQLQVNLTDQMVVIPTAYIQSGAGRMDLAAEYRHPRDSFTTGDIHAHLQTNQVNLAEIRTVQKDQPGMSGMLQANVDVNATKSAAELLPTSVTVDASGRRVQLKGQDYGDFTVAARTNNQTVSYDVTSNFAGSTVRVNGNTQLIRDYPTNADLRMSNLPIDRVLVAAGRPDIPARGTLSATAHVSGTAKAPQGNADFDLTRAVLYDEPLDRVQARIAYLPQSVDLPQLEVTSGPSRVSMTARYDHPAGDMQRGSAQFNIESSRIDLARIRNVQRMRPGLGGTLEINANGEGTVRAGAPRILFNRLNARLGANGLAAQGRNFGNLNLTANTAAGNRLTFALDSNLADAAIHGNGDAQLTGDYPVNAQLTFSNILYTHVQALLGPVSGAESDFEGATDGQITVNGPVMKTDQLRGALRLSRLNLTTLPRPGRGKSLSIANQGAIAVTLEAGTVRIQSAHLTGPQTDIQADGTAALLTATRALNLNVKANADLGVIPEFNRDIDSSGKVVLGTAIRGTMSQPLINGELALQNASFNYRGIPNGLSKTNGVIAFNGNNARIRDLTGESGGGKLTLSGFVGFANITRFALRANASNVRWRTEQGASAVIGAELRLSGTRNNSVASGTVTVEQVNYNPQSDIGSMLSKAAPPVQSPSAPSPILENMKLDVQVRTSAGLAVQAALARNLQADADLRVQGTAATPGVVGRITITEGQLVFFGSTYTVDRGSVSFFNPLRIEPILDLSLVTEAKSVKVVLHVTGPIDNMNLSYTSDPPLQFQEIVSLLASGKTPTSDPTLLANQPQTPPASFQQMGESALLGKALAEPVSSRLERVFGVTQLKIDPSFTSGNDIPTARLTLQQQITQNLTFTYTSALDDPNGQIIRIEWSFSPQWAAVANRDQNGMFSINFLYKRQFR